MADITHEIKEHYGVLSENQQGWTKQVNLVSWNERQPKVEVREWIEDLTRLGKGITFTFDEVVALKEIINSIDLKELKKLSG